MPGGAHHLTSVAERDTLGKSRECGFRVQDYRLAQRRDFREFAQSTYDESSSAVDVSVADVA